MFRGVAFVAVFATAAHAQPSAAPPAEPPPPDADAQKILDDAGASTPTPPPNPPNTPPAAPNAPVTGLGPSAMEPVTGLMLPKASVRDRPWSITFGIGGMDLSAKTEPEETKTALTVIDLAAHYRITPAIQLGLSINAGGAAKGNVSAGGIYIDFRYRFLAERPWNVYAIASLGSMSAADKEGTEEEKKGRGSLRFGLGGERRFKRFGIWAELRAGGVAENKDVPVPFVATAEWNFARYGLSFGTFTLGGTFYF